MRGCGTARGNGALWGRRRLRSAPLLTSPHGLRCGPGRPLLSGNVQNALLSSFPSFLLSSLPHRQCNSGFVSPVPAAPSLSFLPTRPLALSGTLRPPPRRLFPA